MPKHEKISDKDVDVDLIIHSKAFYHHLARLTPEAIVIHSKGRIIYANPAALKLTKADSSSQIIGQPIEKFIHPRSLPLAKERISKILREKMVLETIEETFIDLMGGIICAEVKSIPFITDNNTAIMTLIHDISQRKKEEERQIFLNNISEVLGSSINYQTTLKNIGKLIVPYMADYMRIALVDDNRTIKHIVEYHKNKELIPLVRSLYENYKNINNIKYGVNHILKTGKPEIMEKITPEDQPILRNMNKKLKSNLENLKLTSYMGVPLKVRNRILGAVTFSSSDGNKIYTTEDLKLAQEVAARISYSVENATLFKEVQDESIKRERLSSIIKSSQDAIIGINLKRIIYSWNRGAEKLYDYKEKDVVGKTIKIICSKDRHKDIDYFIQQAKKDLSIERYLTKCVHKNGRSIDIEMTISPIKNSDGKIIGCSLISRDMTEMIRHENNLKYLSQVSKILSSSLDYNVTLESIAKLAVPYIADWCTVDMVTTDGSVVQIGLEHKNPALIKWARRYRNTTPINLEQNTGIAKVIKTGKPQYVPYVTPQMIENASKTDRDIKKLIEKIGLTSVMIVPLSVRKKPVGAISFISAESGYRFTRGDLATALELANRASLAIENAKLYSEAKDAINARNEFISIASHELKTPVTTLKMYAQILTQQTALLENGNTYAAKMNEQLDRLSMLVSDLLNVSKIEHGKLEYKLEDFYIKDLIIEIKEVMESSSGRHKLKLVGDINQRVHADRYRIYQVLTNLISNAIKYSPGAKEVIIQLAKRNNEAVISVKDFGIGIDKKHHDKIFGQFYRINIPEERTFPGLGMGLYIANEIIKRHGGKMTINSERGKGAEFTFSLPLIN